MERLYAKINIMIAFSFCCFFIAANADDIMLVSQEKTSAYKIVQAKNADSCAVYAVSEFQKFVEEISGVRLPVANDTEPLPEKAVIIGRIDKMPAQIDCKTLNRDGFIIKTIGERIYITGKNSRATLYGVYEFLEKYLGCRWYTCKVSKIPKRQKLLIPSLDVKYNPPFEFRDIYYLQASDSVWAARNKINGVLCSLEGKYGGKGVCYLPQYFVHTYLKLVPPAKYFAKHPEYYNLVAGKRKADGLCLSNPEVRRIAVENLKKLLPQGKGKFVISISQMDGEQVCECKKCREMAAAENGESGAVIKLANEAAEAVKDNPQVMIDTIAYHHTLPPPAKTAARPNVIVKMCPIEADCSAPLSDRSSKSNRSIYKNLRNWTSKAKHLYVWYYVANYGHYYMPLPNIYSLSSDIKLFHKLGVEGVFAQGSYSITGNGGEFCELRAYLLAKLLWNPDADPAAIIDDFLSGYYGDAGKYINEYLELLREQVRKTKLKHSDFEYRIDKRTDTRFLTREFLGKAEEIFKKAELASKKQGEDYYQRVQVASMSLLYGQLVSETLDEAEEKTAAEKLKMIADRNGLSYLNENGTTIQDFTQKYTAERIRFKNPETKLFGPYKLSLARPYPAVRWWCKIVDDSSAPVKKAVLLPNQNGEWSVQWVPGKRTFKPGKEYEFSVIVKIDKKGERGNAFSVGIYDRKNKKNVAGKTFSARELQNGAWKELHITSSRSFNPDCTFYVAPANNMGNVPNIYVGGFKFSPVNFYSRKYQAGKTGGKK